MRITVLGSAAGGGFPQWNCNCRNCSGVRSGAVRAKARTQSSIFVRPDAHTEGVLFNASPDILEQIRSEPALQPGRAVRDTAIAAVLLMDGQIDHATGLFMLRERGSPLPLWCTDPVEQDLTQGNPVLRVLGHYCGVERHRIALEGSAFEVPAVPGLSFRAFAARQQGGALFPAPRRARAGRQHRHADQRQRARQQRLLRPRPGRDHAGAVRRDVQCRRGAGGRHVLERRRDAAPGPVTQVGTRHRPPAAVRARAA